MDARRRRVPSETLILGLPQALSMRRACQSPRGDFQNSLCSQQLRSPGCCDNGCVTVSRARDHPPLSKPSARGISPGAQAGFTAGPKPFALLGRGEASPPLGLSPGTNAADSASASKRPISPGANEVKLLRIASRWLATGVTGPASLSLSSSSARLLIMLRCRCSCLHRGDSSSMSSNAVLDNDRMILGLRGASAAGSASIFTPEWRFFGFVHEQNASMSKSLCVIVTWRSSSRSSAPIDKERCIRQSLAGSDGSPRRLRLPIAL
mmetsp:Transcript_55110/g.108838  ORF Transcript_55110/g.108838 Transcript_55110/m.108838 type:complete len:265 (+) Transcript_55110:278-1072(+)